MRSAAAQHFINTVLTHTSIILQTWCQPSCNAKVLATLLALSRQALESQLSSATKSGESFPTQKSSESVYNPAKKCGESFPTQKSFNILNNPAKKCGESFPTFAEQALLSQILRVYCQAQEQLEQGAGEASALAGELAALRARLALI